MSNSIINKIYIDTTTKEAVSSAPCNGTLHIVWTNEKYNADTPFKFVVKVVFDDGSRVLTAEKIITQPSTQTTTTSTITLNPGYMPITSQTKAAIYVEDYRTSFSPSNPWSFVGRGPSVNFTLTIPNTTEYYPSIVGEPSLQWNGGIRGAEEEEVYYHLAGETTFTADFNYKPGDGSFCKIVLNYLKTQQGDDSTSKLTILQPERLEDDIGHIEYEHSFDNNGEYQFKFLCVDTRDRHGPSALVTDSKRIWSYQKPSATVDIGRDVSSQDVAVIKCSYSCHRTSLGDDDTGNVIKAIHIDRKDLTMDSAWQNDWRTCDITGTDSGILTIALADDDEESNYIYQTHEWAFRVWVDDTVMIAKYPTMAARRAQSIISATVQIQGMSDRIVNVHRDGTGIAFGKIADKGKTFECSLNSVFDGSVTINDGEDKKIILQNMCYPLCLDDDSWDINPDTDAGRVVKANVTKFGTAEDGCSVKLVASSNDPNVTWAPQTKNYGRIRPKLDNKHVYYACMWIYQDVPCGTVDVLWPADDNTAIVGGYILAARTWTRISTTFDRTNRVNGVADMLIRYNNAWLEEDSQWAASSICIDGLTIYDLTAAFGAGNEPTKLWCDQNLEYEYRTEEYEPIVDFTCNAPATFNDTVNITSINNLPFKDFIIDEYTSGNWYCRTWSSGIAEFWCRYRISGWTCNTPVGSWYKTYEIPMPNYPHAFIEAPKLNMYFESRSGTGGILWPTNYDEVGENSALTAPNNVYVIRMTSSDLINGYINVHAIGRIW